MSEDTLTVKKSVVLNVAEANDTYVIQINKIVLWALLFVINYPMLREVVIWAYRLFN